MNGEGTILMTGTELANLIRRLATGRDEYMTVREAADYMRQRVATIRRWIRERLLVASMPTPGKILVRKKDLDGIFRRSRVDPDEPTPLMQERARHAQKAQAARKAKRGAEDLETETTGDMT